MKETVSFYTLGCRLNQAETAIIERSFELAGYEITDFGNASDLVVINTCTVTENGDADTRRIVNKVNRNNKNAKIALIGCQAQVQGEKLAKLPHVHWVIGNASKMDIVNLLKENQTDVPWVHNPEIKKESFTIPIAGIDKHHTRANLKIQDGCDFFCTYCEIPYARGRARSRKYENILQEAQELINAGHHELVITGINVGCYSNQDKTILDVISELEKLEGLLRIRISSIEPTTIPETILTRMAKGNKLCRYLHVPMQHGHDEILASMHRKYTILEFNKFIDSAYTLIPDVCLGTDVIVGFPGETEIHFEETYNLLLESPFAYFHVFRYSDRNHNKSRKYADKVPKNIIDERSRRLRELSSRKRRAFLEQQIGKTEWVLFEQQKKDFWTGLTDNYIRVKVKSSTNLENQFIPVELDRVDNQTVIGYVQ